MIPFSCLATRSAAVDLVYALPSFINTKEFILLAVRSYLASNCCPGSLCKEANLKTALGSCFITY